MADVTLKFNVTSADRSLRKVVVAKSFEILVEKCKETFEILDSTPIRIVLESDGTEVDDDLFPRVPNMSQLMVLKELELWTTVKTPTSGQVQPLRRSGFMPTGKDVLVGTAVGVSTVLAAPVVLSAVGFGAAGVVAGSIAAAIQGPLTAAGSWFALCQSAGVLGLAASTNVALGTAAGGSAIIVKKAIGK